MDLDDAFLTGFPGVNQLKTVTTSEMLRLNTGIAAKPAAQQSTFGVAGNDLAGFPNGRRPGDDVVDLALRVVMGRLCHPVPVNGTPTDLGLCKPKDAPVGQRRVHRRRADQRCGLRRDVPVPQDAVPGIRKLSPWACALLPAGGRRSRHGPRPSPFSPPSPAPRRPRDTVRPTATRSCSCCRTACRGRRRGQPTPRNPERTAIEAEAFLRLARTTRDARYFGRAEALVEPWIARRDATPRLLVAAADLAQQRHEFESARQLLDRAIDADPRTAERAFSARTSHCCSANSARPAATASPCCRAARRFREPSAWHRR